MMRFNRPLVAAVPVALLLGFLAVWCGVDHPSPVERPRPVRAYPLLTRSVLPPSSEAGPAENTEGAAAEQAKPREHAGRFAAFNSWAEKYLASATPALKAASLAEGESLANARREEMLSLIKTDPARALAQAAPYHMRKQLPASITSLLEERVSGRGELTVVHVSPLPGHEKDVRPEFHRVSLNHKTYEAYVYGHRKEQSSRRGLALHGVAVGNVMALSADPVRILAAEEAQDLLAAGAVRPEAICSMSGLDPATTGGRTWADLGGQILNFCQPTHVALMNAQLSDAESQLTFASVSGSSTTLPPAGGSATEGTKTLLLIPVTFLDDPRVPISEDAFAAAAAGNNQYFNDGSYGSVSFLTTITPVVRLPQRAEYYSEFLAPDLNNDAVAGALALGYDVTQFQFHYVLFNPLPGVYFGGRSDNLLNGAAGALSHELGHNFGLGHANFYDTRGNAPLPPQPAPPVGPYPFDPDSLVGHADINAPVVLGADPPEVEYGNIYDVMGSGGGHFSAYLKHRIKWLPEQATRVLATSETNRIYAFDTPRIQEGRLYALRFRKNATRTFWASYRQGFPNNPWLSSGIELLWNALLLDTTPGSLAGKNDAAVVVGRTFNDPECNFHMTPIAKGGEGLDKWIDVVVQVGPFPTNAAPTLSIAASELVVPNGTEVTFTATASDTNGDAIAYYWNFGDETFGSNSPTNTKTFFNTGYYVVRCEASDMKGGLASGQVLVTVGSPTNFTMSGRVIDTSGKGLQGVRVHNSGVIPTSPTLPQDGVPPPPFTTNNGTYRYSYTDSDGYYTIPNVPAGTFTNRAFIYGYRTEPLNFNDPVTLVDSGASGLDHLATALTKVSISVRSNAVEGVIPIPGQFTFTRVGATNIDLPVLFQVSGDALPDVNYTALSTNIPATNVIVIRAGDYSTNLSVRPINDLVGDGPKTVTLTLLLQPSDIRISESITNIITTNIDLVLYTNSMIVYTTNVVTIPGWEALPRGQDNQPTWFQTDPTYVLGTSEATMTIRDDDTPSKPFVSIVALDSDAVETGQDSAVLMFTRSLGARGAVEGNLQVTFKAGGGTATYGVDYAALSSSITNTVTIPSGQSFVIVPIYALNDLYVEGNETEVFTILSSPNYSGAGGSATIFIIDDDLPLVSVYASDSIAGKAGNLGTLTFSRAGDLESDLLVNFLVQDGSAVSGVDYQTLPGSVVIPAGQISADVTVQPINNPNSTGAKLVTVLISDSTTYNIVGLGRATVTIRDILPEVTLEVTTGTANEAGTPGVFTVRRTGPNTNQSLVVYFEVGGSAVENSDYAPIGTNVVIPAGAGSARITIAPIEDPFKEYNDVFLLIGGAVSPSKRVNEYETIFIQLVGGPDYNLGGATAGVVVIEDNDPLDLSAVGFMTRSSSGREDSTKARLPVFISANTATNRSPVVVDYRVTSGTAIQGINYSFVGTAQVKFTNYVPADVPGFSDFAEPFAQIQFIEIPLLDDSQVTGDKTFTITLFPPSGYDTNYVTNTMTMVVSTNLTKIPTNAYLADYRSHTFTIIDVGTTRIDIQATTSLAYETGAQPAVFRISRSGGGTAKPLTVRFSVAGTATSGSDYLPLGNSITIPAGTNAVNLLVTPIDDPAEEYAESVIVTLQNSPGLKLGTASATAIIVDNDGTIQFTSASYQVSEGATNAVVSVQRTGDTNLAVTVDYIAGNGTALSGSDFTATNGTLSFAPGEVLRNITIAIANDSLVELTETVSLRLTNVTGAIPLGGQDRATLFILDDDSAFDFTASRFEVNENVANATISVHRSGLTNFTATVDFMTVGGSAITNLDYLAVTNTLTFAAGVTNLTVLVPIRDDFLLDGDQTVDLLLSNASTNTAVGTNGTAQLVIVDDECQLEFAASPVSVDEYAGVVTLEVRRVGGTIHPVSVNYATTNGSATNVIDYLAKSGKLDFRADAFVLLSDGSGQTEFRKGETNKTITITIVDDAIGEGPESFGVNLTNAIITGSAVPSPSVTLGTLSLAAVNIIDNENPGNVDYEFNPGLGANDTVLSVAVQPSLKVILGGKFTGVDGVVYSRIARLEANGHLDNSFNPGSGANDVVQVVATQPDGKILLGGAFTRLDNTDRNHIARLNADGDLDLGFKPGLGANNLVRAIALQTDGKVIIAGDFTKVNGVDRGHLARLHPDGRLDNTFIASANNSVYALAVQSDGKILLGGSFSSVNGNDRNFIARVNTNGFTDVTFNPAQGPSARVNALAVQSGGGIVIGGNFLNVNGINWSYLGRLLTNGLPDSSFNPGTGPNAPVLSLAVQPNGKITIGGDFTRFNGVSRNRFTRLRADGALDNLFNIGTGANATVQTVAVQADSAIIIGGDFTEVFGLPRNRIARIHGDEKSDLVGVEFSSATYTFSEGDGAVSIAVQRTGATNRAFTVSLLITTNGSATLGDDFTMTGGLLSFASGEMSKAIPLTIVDDILLEETESICLFLTNAPASVDMSGVVAAKVYIRDNEKSFFLSATNYNVGEGETNVVVTVDRIGSLDGAASVTLSTVDGVAVAPADYTSLTQILDFPPGLASQSVSILIYDDDLVEGDETFNVRLSNIVGDVLPGRTNATVTIKDNEPGPGGVDRSFDPGVGGNQFVRAVTLQADNKVVVGGGFTVWDNTNRHYITRLNTNGTHDLTFDPGLGADALVSSVAMTPDGRIVLGGSFSNFNGAAFNRMARLETNGALDLNFSGVTGFDAGVNIVAAQPNGRLVVGGGFSLPTRGAVRLRANGTIDTGFNLGVGTDGPVYCAALYPDGRVAIGGAFRTVNGWPRSRVAVLLPNGLVDQSFVPPFLANGTIYGLAVQTDGRLVIAGDFSVFLRTNCHGIARLNENGSLDATFDPGSGANQSVFAVGLQANGRVVVAGDFTAINGTNRFRYARLRTSGSLDTGFDPGLGANNSVYSLAIQADNHIILGGDFTKVNGVARSGVARVIGRDDDLRFISFVLLPGQIAMTILSQPGRSYVLDVSTSLPNWIPLRTNTASGLTLTFIEPIDGSSQKFFQVRPWEP